MRTFVSALAASLLVAASASAQTTVSDQDYVQMARCAGLIAGARQDAAPYDRAVREASAGRPRSVRNAAGAQRRGAAEQMHRADDALKARLQAEISAKCAAPAA